MNGLLETYANDAGDKLTSVAWTGGSKSFTYDAAGRTTSITTASGTTSLAYDYESRVTSITYPNASVDTFAYNGLDTRVGKGGAQGSATFKRNGVGVTAPVLSDGSATFTPGISERRSGATTYSHSGIKNAEVQTSSSQTISATNQYDAFGNLASSTGTWNGPFAYGGPFGYQTDSSGLKLLGHRYYDSGTGRFLTRDPIKDGRNWYGYCGNSPISFADPTGCFIPILLVILGGAMIGGGLGAWADPEDRWGGFGRGFVIGGIGAGVGLATGGLSTFGLGAIGVDGALGGAVAGGLGGAAGSAAGQGAAIGFGWQETFDWGAVGAGAFGGSIFGGGLIRPVPSNGFIPVTHWGDPSPWVQVGGPSFKNWIMAGRPPGASSTFIVDAKSLISPGGREFGKGLLGQRIYTAWQ